MPKRDIYKILWIFHALFRIITTHELLLTMIFLTFVLLIVGMCLLISGTDPIRRCCPPPAEPEANNEGSMLRTFGTLREDRRNRYQTTPKIIAQTEMEDVTVEITMPLQPSQNEKC
ncbi:hypothetical protein [Wolbachia endosymbiont of Ctenocephalides felis wCfeT]|uniref:hypothetical protein n=1 Tax=Wolbachia endosymbiont of Ctenocephalides felis wCfeT TaxID=2732593 RepID=UPI00144516D2|nr:hypothetical protein [Wolbachia endosymbiont of Ctenocephalides felis wCfeT]